MTERFTDQVAVVTGAAQGIGLAIAERLASEGAHVVITDLNDDAGRAAADRIGGTYRHLDSGDSSAIADAARAIAAEHGRIDVLVNNAGVAHDDASLELSDETWAKVIGLDLSGVFFACREFGRVMVDQGRGSIVNISSISGVLGTNPDVHAAYDAAKAGVAQLARTLGVEWAEHGVRVNAVAPTRTRTPILDQVASEDPGQMDEWMRQVPMRRLLEPEEIASAVAFLASGDASGVTGHTLMVDGGHTVS